MGKLIKNEIVVVITSSDRIIGVTENDAVCWETQNNITDFVYKGESRIFLCIETPLAQEEVNELLLALKNRIKKSDSIKLIEGPQLLGEPMKGNSRYKNIISVNNAMKECKFYFEVRKMVDDE
ncbi:MAG: hypothetical protein J6J09_10635 [Phocaeicola sp.]|nr:hypothetical protein [Phocaeicola sp.]